MYTLYLPPKDHAFSIRYGGNLYVRGGKQIDPDDPNTVRPRRPRLTRNAAKKFIHGAGEDILNEGQKADDEAARKAQEDHAKKFVSRAVLFNPPDIFIGLQKGNKLHSNSVGNQQPNYVLSGIEKHCALTPFWYRESE